MKGRNSTDTAFYLCSLNLLRWMESMKNLSVAVVPILNEGSLIHFHMENVLVADSLGSMCLRWTVPYDCSPNGDETRHSDRGSCGQVSCMICDPKNHLVFCIYINIQREVAIFISLHGDMNIAVHATDIAQEIIQFLWSTWPNHERSLSNQN